MDEIVQGQNCPRTILSKDEIVQEGVDIIVQTSGHSHSNTYQPSFIDYSDSVTTHSTTLFTGDAETAAKESIGAQHKFIDSEKHSTAHSRIHRQRQLWTNTDPMQVQGKWIYRRRHQVGTGDCHWTRTVHPSDCYGRRIPITTPDIEGVPLLL